MPRKTEHISIGGRRITVSNLHKLLYPGTKFTKADVIDYYVNISKYLLPHLKNHPITLKRFPDGVFGEAFYEKDAPSFTPEWVKTVPVPRRETPGPDIQYIVINDGLKTYAAKRDFDLNGTKLKGEWTLKRIADGKDERDSRDKWQLIKTSKNTRAVSKKRDDESALTKRTMMQIASAADAVWQSNRR